jgi:hypothetical protein
MRPRACSMNDAAVADLIERRAELRAARGQLLGGALVAQLNEDEASIEQIEKLNGRLAALEAAADADQAEWIAGMCEDLNDG